MISVSPLMKSVDDPNYWPMQFRGGPWDGDFIFFDVKTCFNREIDLSNSMPPELAIGPTLGIPERCRYRLATVRYDDNGSEFRCYMYMGKLRIEPEIETWIRESCCGRSIHPDGIPSRDDWGRLVREIWIRWARHQPNCKPTWLTPYDDLNEPDKEVDRRIGFDIAHTAVAISRRFPLTFKH